MPIQAQTDPTQTLVGFKHSLQFKIMDKDFQFIKPYTLGLVKDLS